MTTAVVSSGVAASKSFVRTRTVVRRVIVAAVGLVFVLALWEWASRSYGSPMLFPGPGDTFNGLIDSFQAGIMTDAILSSLRRILSGFAIGVTVGVVLGLAAGGSRIVWGLLEPFVNFFRSVPPLAWFAPALLLLGAGEKSQIALIVYTTVFVVLVNTMAGVRSVPKAKTRMASSFGAGRVRTLALVVLPSSLPYVLAGMRIALGNAFMTVVTAEMLGAQAGLGVIINNGMTTLNMVSVLGAIITLGVLGLISDVIFGVFVRRAGRRFAV